MTLTAGDVAIDLSWVVLPDDDVPICESFCQERAAQWIARFSCGHGHYACGPCKDEENFEALLYGMSCPPKCSCSRAGCRHIAWEPYRKGA